MKKFLLTSLFLAIITLTGSLKAETYETNAENFEKNKPVRAYTISGAFQLGSITYTYVIVIDATICIICNPPTITINHIISATICIQNTNICGSIGVARVQHDANDNLEYIEFTVDNISDNEEIEEYINGEIFQSELKEKLLDEERQ